MSWASAGHSGPAPVLVIAGDIAQCGRQGAELTARLIDNLPDAMVLAAGDLAYPNGSADDYRRCYEPTWGRFKERTWPAPGNHEYLTADASGYFDYFGERAGPRGRGYYSTDFGGWHIVSLNSNADAGPTSEQVTWLKKDLAVNRHTCVLAYWHHPRFTSGPHGDRSAMATIWEILYEYGVSIAVAGHDHDYERFAPLNGKGQLDERLGIRSFVVGTGGARLYDLNLRSEYSEVWNGTNWGVLKLTLHPDRYDWEFVPVAGGTFRDAGSARCVSR